MIHFKLLIGAAASALIAGSAYADPPYFGPSMAMNMPQGQPINLDATAVDPDGDALTLTATGLPPGMSLTVTDEAWRVDTLLQSPPNTVYMDVVAHPSDGYYVTRYNYPSQGSGSSTDLLHIQDDGSETVIASQAGHMGGIAVHPDGSVYIYRLHRIKKIIGGQLTHYAGVVNTSGHAGGYVDGPLNVAHFDGIESLVFDSQGEAYIGEHSGRIRKIDTAGNVTTLATLPALGSGSSNESSASDISVSDQGEIYVLNDDHHAVYVLDPAQQYTPVPLSIATNGYSSQNAALNQLGSPIGMGVLTNGRILIANGFGGYISEVDPNGGTLTVLGGGNNAKSDGGPDYGQMQALLALTLDTADAQAYVIDAGGVGDYHIRALTKVPSNWAITGTYSGSHCGGSYSVIVTATDTNGETAATSHSITIPPAPGPGCGGPPGGPGGSVPTGPGGKVIGGSVVVGTPTPVGTINDVTRERIESAAAGQTAIDSAVENVADEESEASEQSAGRDKVQARRRTAKKIER